MCFLNNHNNKHHFLVLQSEAWGEGLSSINFFFVFLSLTKKISWRQHKNNLNYIFKKSWFFPTFFPMSRLVDNFYNNLWCTFTNHLCLRKQTKIHIFLMISYLTNLGCQKFDSKLRLLTDQIYVWSPNKLLLWGKTF